MASEMIKALEDLEKEKGIQKEYMLDRISQALVAAYKALYKRDPQSAPLDNVFVHIDEETGAITMHAVKTVVEEVEDALWFEAKCSGSWAARHKTHLATQGGHKFYG